VPPLKLIPTACAVGHILAPLPRLGIMLKRSSQCLQARDPPRRSGEVNSALEQRIDPPPTKLA
jgi:hypothetical protein